MSAPPADRPVERLGDILPLNTIELMTVINFHHLDEARLLDGGKVLKQKSGYTHLFREELVSILEELGMDPPPGLVEAYGRNYRHVLDFNLTLLAPPFTPAPDPGSLGAFSLLARHAFKYYSPMQGYDEPLQRLRGAVEGGFDAARVAELARGITADLERLLTVERPVPAVAFPRATLERLGLLRPAVKRCRYQLFDRLAAALDRLPGDFPAWLELDGRVRAFARRHAALLSVIIRAFQAVGVKVEVVDSPNHDYLRFHERYVGPLDMARPLPEGFTASGGKDGH